MSAAEKIHSTVANNAFTGERKEGFKTSHVIGVIGGIAGGLSAYGEGSSLIASVAGGLVGGACGYAVGKAFSIGDDFGAASRIIGGACAGVTGLGFAGITAGVINSIAKLGGETAE